MEFITLLLQSQAGYNYLVTFVKFPHVKALPLSFNTVLHQCYFISLLLHIFAINWQSNDTLYINTNGLSIISSPHHFDAEFLSPAMAKPLGGEGHRNARRPSVRPSVRHKAC